MEKLNCVLLIDNNVSSVFSTYRYLSRTKEIQTIQFERGALSAMQFLQYFLYSNNKSLPELIILNLDLPDKEGIQFLTIIKEFVGKTSQSVKIIATTRKGLTEEMNEEDKNYLITYTAKDRLLHHLNNFFKKDSSPNTVDQ